MDLSTRGKIRVLGEDRARLLHAMTTQDVQSLIPGHGVYAFFLNAQGRILGDVNIFCREDCFLLDTEPELRERVHQHIRRYIIADQVELEDVSDNTGCIGLEGPGAAAILGTLGAPVPADDFAHRAAAGRQHHPGLLRPAVLL
jgi:folate-binding Fe-S cluster repair protein YgfZ